MQTQMSVETNPRAFAPVRFEDSPALRLAGMEQQYTFEDRTDIPLLWNRFGPRIADLPNTVGLAAYGVLTGTPDGDGFDYLAAVEICETDTLPADLVVRELPARRYAVFPHDGPLGTLCETIRGAFDHWLPESGYEATGSPDFIEFYGEQFDPRTGTGGMEIRIPIKTEKADQSQ